MDDETKGNEMVKVKMCKIGREGLCSLDGLYLTRAMCQSRCDKLNLAEGGFGGCLGYHHVVEVLVDVVACVGVGTGGVAESVEVKAVSGEPIKLRKFEMELIPWHLHMPCGVDSWICRAVFVVDGKDVKYDTGYLKTDDFYAAVVASQGQMQGTLMRLMKEKIEKKLEASS